MAETLLLVGLQWGDEGKGKVIDALAPRFDVVVRFQGGANAGHTVHIGEEEYVLHVVPSGILHPEKLCVVGNGVVVDPPGLLEEMGDLRERGVEVGENLRISDRAHVVLPHHKAMDQAREGARGDGALGTTGRGIGPCYSDKASRDGIRMAEFVDPPVFRARLEALLGRANEILTRAYGADALQLDAIYEEYSVYADQLRPHVCDSVSLLHEKLDTGHGILLEGAQGCLLDLEFGTYPFVTSSAVISGAPGGTGIPMGRIDRVIGVAKAYCSRVGTGPFPTEQDNAIGETIRTTIEGHGGREYGATTGRKRRTGWLDAVALRYTARLAGCDTMALSVLDVLGAFETIKVCTAYRVDGETLETVPAQTGLLDHVEPVYEEFEGWQCDVSGARTWDDLPPQARAYVEAVEALAGVPIAFISVGPRRSQVIERRSL